MSAIRALAEDLVSRSDAELRRLMSARPDVVLPPVPDFAALAARGSTRVSVQRALEGHGPSLRYAIELHMEAVRQHRDRFSEYFGFVEMVEHNAIEKPVPPVNEHFQRKFINDLRRKTRRT